MLDVMISSTVKDMLPDREAIDSALLEIPFVRTVGAKPVKQSPVAGSPYAVTTDMAASCHLYILLLGGRYGDAQEGHKSPTELEFDAAYQDDPTKILVFKKRVRRTQKLQYEFIERVGNYYSGSWFTSYTEPKELHDHVMAAFEHWIRERAAIGSKLNYFDHFVRMSIQRVPFPGAQVSYLIDEKDIEFRYNIFGTKRTIHFAKSEVLTDFWGCIALLDRRFGEWRSG